MAASKTLRVKASVAEASSARFGLDHDAQRLGAALVEVVFLLAADQAEDRHEFFGVVVGELDGPCESAFEARVRVDQFDHFGGVAGSDHRQVVTVVFHELDDRVDGFEAEVVFATPGKGIGLVDEERSSERRLQDLLRRRRGLPDEAGNEAGAVGLDEVAFADHAEGAEDLGEQSGDGGLAGARISGEDQMLTGLNNGEVGSSSQFLNAQQRRQPADLSLDMIEADQRVEFRE